jgi:hypothetical protein
VVKNAKVIGALKNVEYVKSAVKNWSQRMTYIASFVHAVLNEEVSWYGFS